MVYPINHLHYSVMESLSQIEIVRHAINKGLKNNILLEENDNGRRVLSDISCDGQVRLSPAFCQFLWNMSYAALIITDTGRILQELKQIGIDKDMFIKMIQGYSSIPEIGFLLSELNAIPADKMIEVGMECIEDDDLRPKEINEILEKQDMTSPFSQRVNSIYMAGVSFVLLHELFHWVRGHFEEKILPIDQEKEADNYAFDEILKTFSRNEAEKKTYALGIMSVLCSFFYLNPQFQNNGTYPHCDERLFAQYDKLDGKAADDSCSVIVHFLSLWSKYYRINKFPTLTGNDYNDLKKLRIFLESYNR